MSTEALQFEEVVVEERRSIIQFKEIGQQVTGIYQGTQEIEGRYGPELHLLFADFGSGEELSVRANPDLKQKAEKLTVGNIARITYVADKDIGKASPMRVFKVEQAPAPKPAAVPF